MGPPTFKKASKHSCAGYDVNGRCECAEEIFDPIWVPAAIENSVVSQFEFAAKILP